MKIIENEKEKRKLHSSIWQDSEHPVVVKKKSH